MKINSEFEEIEFNIPPTVGLVPIKGTINAKTIINTIIIIWKNEILIKRKNCPLDGDEDEIRRGVVELKK